MSPRQDRKRQEMLLGTLGYADSAAFADGSGAWAYHRAGIPSWCDLAMGSLAPHK